MAQFNDDALNQDDQSMHQGSGVLRADSSAQS